MRKLQDDDIVEKFGLFMTEIEQVKIDEHYDGTQCFIMTELENALNFLVENSCDDSLTFLIIEKLIFCLTYLHNKFLYVKVEEDSQKNFSRSHNLTLIILSLTLKAFYSKRSEIWKRLEKKCSPLLEKIGLYLLNREWKNDCLMREIVILIYRSVFECEIFYLWYKQVDTNGKVLNTKFTYSNSSFEQRSRDFKGKA